MKRLLTANWLLFLFFFSGCFLFFEINYRFMYRFMEQYQLFLYTTNYFFDLLAQPGGYNEYITSFIAQFFFFPFVAPVCLAVLLTAIGFLFWLFIKRCGVEVSALPALLPVFLFWVFPVESIASILSVLTGVASAYGYTFIRKPVIRYSSGVVFILFLYFLATPAHLLAAVLFGLYEYCSGENKRRFAIGAGLIILALLLPLVAMRTLYIIPMREAYFSKFLYHPEYPLPTSFWYTWCAFPLMVLLVYLLRNRKKVFRKDWINGFAICLTLLLIIGGGIFFRENPLEQVYRYDWLARQQQWDKIITHAEKHPAKDQDALVYVNLASAYTDSFNKALMRFKQIGEDGFIPYDPRTRLGLIEAEEVAWTVNQTNASQRFAFVGVLSSERCVQPRLMKRLIETYLVNEEYKAAEKYIRILEQTLLYSSWAREQRKLLQPEVAESTPWIMAKRKLNPVTDNPHDLTKSFPNAIAFLIDDHPENRIAFEYGMGYLLIHKELGAFMHYMKALNERGEALPVLYQEAICIYYSAVEQNPETFSSFPIDPAVYNRFTTYLQQVRTLSPTLLARQYGDTYYYYAQSVQPPKRQNR
ncbi:tetratricopeptide (TPR) repeat protein [Parabacteroides sp. PF5-5]|uniref:DUF6057 family protein n=1 Tax=unclassified Parabacteroides TaxID=2649774 RepID=UPI002474889D|nr:MULTISPECIES: DUF6057 family protein [unclassified Parabacteroides]MDH6306003.1 tetratricopeptide (TPR) repeat protein [Parabacteroides sp. PH5-39]MDH6317259.1 tetratricopeptide (TPR) repeat protein [Parabacteroides sp. PF5-13]MDH6320715.1 tetratricopeptide (TPR) repeat protein [Parabacteroides sp. PH5-13]MDH6324364.1 tetratricopeptide (TPR) repeat protein [Parabacteroides sp. PH5-8]MDH6328444.1 tetratricopeptide (TPR) repeat protein [Parabacteroides sp. PH5-41]